MYRVSSIIMFDHTGKGEARSKRNRRLWFPGCTQYFQKLSATLNFQKMYNPSSNINKHHYDGRHHHYHHRLTSLHNPHVTPQIVDRTVLPSSQLNVILISFIINHISCDLCILTALKQTCNTVLYGTKWKATSRSQQCSILVKHSQ